MSKIRNLSFFLICLVFSEIGWASQSTVIAIDLSLDSSQMESATSIASSIASSLESSELIGLVGADDIVRKVIEPSSPADFINELAKLAPEPEPSEVSNFAIALERSLAMAKDQIGDKRIVLISNSTINTLDQASDDRYSQWGNLILIPDIAQQEIQLILILTDTTSNPDIINSAINASTDNAYYALPKDQASVQILVQSLTKETLVAEQPLAVAFEEETLDSDASGGIEDNLNSLELKVSVSDDSLQPQVETPNNAATQNTEAETGLNNTIDTAITFTPQTEITRTNPEQNQDLNTQQEQNSTAEPQDPTVLVTDTTQPEQPIELLAANEAAASPNSQNVEDNLVSSPGNPEEPNLALTDTTETLNAQIKQVTEEQTQLPEIELTVSNPDVELHQIGLIAEPTATNTSDIQENDITESTVDSVQINQDSTTVPIVEAKQQTDSLPESELTDTATGSQVETTVQISGDQTSTAIITNDTKESDSTGTPGAAISKNTIILILLALFGAVSTVLAIFLRRNTRNKVLSQETPLNSRVSDPVQRDGFAVSDDHNSNRSPFDYDNRSDNSSTNHRPRVLDEAREEETVVNREDDIPQSQAEKTALNPGTSGYRTDVTTHEDETVANNPREDITKDSSITEFDGSDYSTTTEPADEFDAFEQSILSKKRKEPID